MDRGWDFRAEWKQAGRWARLWGGGHASGVGGHASMRRNMMQMLGCARLHSTPSKPVPHGPRCTEAVNALRRPSFLTNASTPLLTQSTGLPQELHSRAAELKTQLGSDSQVGTCPLPPGCHPGWLSSASPALGCYTSHLGTDGPE